MYHRSTHKIKCFFLSRYLLTRNSDVCYYSTAPLRKSILFNNFYSNNMKPISLQSESSVEIEISWISER